jgi:hypothetical protein
MITITINPQTADQVQILAAAMVSLLQAPEVATAQAVLPPEQPAKKAKAAKPAPAPTEPAPAPAEPVIALEDVRAKLLAYREKGKSLKDLFATVGCTNLSSVPADRYSELLAKMEEM